MEFTLWTETTQTSSCWAHYYLNHMVLDIELLGKLDDSTQVGRLDGLHVVPVHGDVQRPHFLIIAPTTTTTTTQWACSARPPLPRRTLVFLSWLVVLCCCPVNLVSTPPPEVLVVRWKFKWRTCRGDVQVLEQLDPLHPVTRRRRGVDPGEAQQGALPAREDQMGCPVLNKEDIHVIGVVKLSQWPFTIQPSEARYIDVDLDSGCICGPFTKRILVYPLISYYWTVPLILDHSYLVGKSTSSKIADTKVSGFHLF